jgi:exodeoxyribonuclease V alpha subunit
MKLKEKAQSDSSCSRHFQIITPRNSGPLSVDELNLSLQSSLNPPLNLKKIDLDSDRDIDSAREIIMEGFILRLGDRIMVRKNNYNLGIYNGDIGKVSLITPTEIHVILEDFEGDGETVQIPIQSLDGLIKLAYSVTTHKSQGLEYPYVIIPFVKQHGKNMLQRNLIYTAITRAKKRVIIIGHREAIIQAIENNRIRERNTLLAERLNAWKNGVGISLSKFLLSQQDSLSIPIVKQLLSIEEKNSSVTPMKNLLEVLEEAHQE